MKKIPLGKTGENISALGLGTMYFGTKISRAISYELLDYYRNMGGSFLDTANKYASWIDGCRGGESEETIGEWLKSRGGREQLFISSKVGFAYGDVPRSLKKEWLISECDQSLKRLGTDYIDLYFAHADDYLTEQEEYMETFYRLKKSGKIKFAGASNFETWRLAGANKIANENQWEGFCAVQQRHTLLETSLRADLGTQKVLTPEMQQYSVSNNITLMGYSPLLGGVYKKEYKDVPPHYKNCNSEKHFQALQDLVKETGFSPNAIVLAWMMQSDPNVVPLVTGSSIEQLAENFQATDIILSERQYSELSKDILSPPTFS